MARTSGASYELPSIRASKTTSTVVLWWSILSYLVNHQPEQELELLDSPGIIPARQEDQNQALKLAICNDIGQASYDTQVLHEPRVCFHPRYVVRSIALIVLPGLTMITCKDLPWRGSDRAEVNVMQYP